MNSRCQARVAGPLNQNFTLDRSELDPFRCIGVNALRLHRWLSHRFLTRRLTVRFTREAAGKRRATALLRQSALFDGDWYLQTYPDVAAGRLDPAAHYLNFGWREGRDPGPHFSSNAYLRANADVALAGTNPLIHFIEFGYSEGRGRTKHRAHVRRGPSPGEPFGEPAPCFRVVQSSREPPRWRRAFRLVLTEHLLTIDDLPIGYTARKDRREEVEAAFACLDRLSGNNSRTSAPLFEKPSSALGMADAWHIDQGRLRARWRASEFPIVVRAYQCNPRGNERLAMVGEGLVSSPSDFVDVSLCNRFFPVLFVIAQPHGEIRTCQLLAFPSLCRGGVHYAELLALSRLERDGEPRPMDPVCVGHVLADRLLALRTGTSSSFVSELVVDLGGADGAQPLFQRDFLDWLTQVARIDVRASEPDLEDAAERYLASTIQIAETKSRSNEGASLILAPDMIPTISALTAPSSDGPEVPTVGLSLLVAEADPSQPVSLFEMPCELTDAFQAVEGYPRAWPLLAGGRNGSQTPFAASAIRISSPIDLSDSELLMPASDLTPLAKRVPPIVWMIWPEDWERELLFEALQCISLQDGADDHAIVLIASHDRVVISFVQRLFEHVHVSKTLEDGLAEAQGPLVGFLGTGTILHDRRCSGFLSTLFDDPRVATASCVGVQSELCGKGYQVTIADAGTIAGGVPLDTRAAKRMWRSVYPVVKPPTGFWLARTESCKLDAGGFRLPPDAMNVCTSVVTVSMPIAGSGTASPVTPPAAPDTSSIRSSLLFG